MAKQWRCSYHSTTVYGTDVVNTFHVVARPDTGVLTDASADGVRDTLNTALTTKYKALIGTAGQLLSLVVREEVDPTGGAVPAESSLTINAAGTLTQSSQHLSQGLCILASIYTNAAVRSGHGRLFLPPPIDETFTAGGGTWSSTGAAWVNAKAFMDELMNTHHNGGAGTGWDLVPIVYSRTRRARGDANYYFDVKSYTMRSRQHFLRSRVQ